MDGIGWDWTELNGLNGKGEGTYRGPGGDSASRAGLFVWIGKDGVAGELQGSSGIFLFTWMEE